MINSNYYPYLYFLIAVFAASVNVFVAAEYDDYNDFVPPKSVEVEFIDVGDPRHPSNLCKLRLNISDGEWKEYHEVIIPGNICAKHITCIGTGYNDVAYTGKPPEEGVRCQRVTQNQIYNFGYGCYNRRCVPITCLDEKCWDLLERNRSMQQWLQLSEAQSSSIDGNVQSKNERPRIYRFLKQLSIELPRIYYSYQKPSTSASPPKQTYPNSPTGALQTASPSQADGSQVIRFNLTESEQGL